MNQRSIWKNFVEVIKHHAASTPKMQVLTFIPTRGENTVVSNFNRLDQKAKTIAGYLSAHLHKGDRALLIYEQGIEFIYAFMGCLYAGVIAVPVFPPTFPNMLARLKQIIKDAAPAVCLADTDVCALLQKERSAHDAYRVLNLVDTQTLEDKWEGNYKSTALGHDSLAFLQYTSGSTGSPKGVMVTHGNLLHNEEFMKRRLHHTKESFYVNWMPLYHDMGLIGCVLQACYVGFPIVLMSTQRFLRSPLSWLKIMTEHKATISGGT